VTDEPEIKPPCGNCTCCSRWKSMDNDTAFELDLYVARCDDLSSEACGFAFDAGRELGRQLRHNNLLTGSLREVKGRLRQVQTCAVTFEAEFKRMQRCIEAVIDPRPDSYYDDEQNYFRHKAREALEASGWSPPR
jgi:hypothetical protein